MRHKFFCLESLREAREGMLWGLAPMHGITDLAMRLWMSQTSQPDICWTPFVRVTATFPGQKLPAEFSPELGPLSSLVNYPLFPQFLAADADDFLRAAELIRPLSSWVELNCGCPVGRIVRKGVGSGLLQHPDRFGSFLRYLTDRLGKGRLSVKMRIGYDSPAEFEKLLDAVQSLPLALLSIHGRTRAQGYREWARWDLVAAAASRVDYPVAGSGDILSYPTYQKLSPFLDRVRLCLVGRGALRNPWIFEELRSGTEIVLPFEVLKLGLGVYALLGQLVRHDLPALREAIQDGLFHASCGRDPEKWRHLFDQLLSRARRAKAGVSDLAFDEVIFSRVKMLWSFMGNSLPSVFRQSTVLQSRSFAQLIEQLDRAQALYVRDQQTDQIPLRHDPACDRRYGK